ITVAVALIPLYLRGQISLSSERGLLLLIVATAFVLAGIFDDELAGDPQTQPWRSGVYFFVQTLLVSSILFLTEIEGMSALCLLPLVSNIVANIRNLWFCAALVSAVFGAFLIVLYLLAGTRGFVGNALSILAGFAFVIIFTRIAVRENEARSHAERLSEELTRANEQLRDYASRIEDHARTLERNRMAREIHDSLGHYLTTISVQLEAAQAIFPTDPHRSLSAIAKAHHLSQEALLDVRQSVGSLRAEGDERPLPERIKALAALETNSVVTFALLGEPRILPSETAHALYRTVQEGLTNVRKHAPARPVVLTLDYRNVDRIEVTLANEGPPLVSGAVSSNSSTLPASTSATHSGGGYGLRGLRERIELLGGNLTAGPDDRGGFLLRVEVPA
ncbi:MAG TPA: histidine kinase, partial [Opitutaceae bacterium]|nr:histidine kinase [Opitutaceae bacterium]